MNLSENMPLFLSLKEEEEETSSFEAETVEMDELNQHECMGKICGLIKHLNDTIPHTDKVLGLIKQLNDTITLTDKVLDIFITCFFFMKSTKT